MSIFKEGVPSPDYDSDDVNYISQITEFTDDVFIYGKLYADSLYADISSNIVIKGNLDIDNLNVIGISTFSGNIVGDNSTNISGINSVTATTYFGDGSNLTGIIGVPVGCIIMWSGAINDIPSGFVLCDGTNGTPDLRDKFVVGAGNNYAVDATGGQADAIVPNHTHPTTFDNKKYFPGGGSTSVSFGGAGGYPADVFSMSNPSNGESVTNKNLPPYHALCYIMKT